MSRFSKLDKVIDEFSGFRTQNKFIVDFVYTHSEILSRTPFKGGGCLDMLFC